MPKKDAKIAEPVEDTPEERNRLLESLRRVMLAYVGGWAVAWDELEDLVQRFVERGEVAEKDARKLVKEMREKRGLHTGAGGGVDRRMEELLHRLDVPTRNDIEALTANIAALTAKVDELKKKQA